MLSSIDVADEHDSYYDFNKERIPLMVLSAFLILNRPLVLRYLALILLAIIFAINIVHVVLCIYTISMFTTDKGIILISLLQMILHLLTFTLTFTRFTSTESLDDVLDMLRGGIFIYEAEKKSKDYAAIKVRRVRQIRMLVSFFTKYCFFCALFNTFYNPLVQFLSAEEGKGGEETTDSPFDPYLPLPIYLPFSTDTILGYSLAFFLEGVFFVFAFSVYICHEELYLSMALQLCAQLELLNHSISNIERRAYDKLVQSKMDVGGGNPLSQLYDKDQYQKCLYFCLRENIIHYQGIIRYFKATGPYLETTNFIIVFVYSLLLATEVLLVLENPSLNLAVSLTLFSDLSGLLQMMYVGQMVINESEQITNVLYSTPWVLCDKKFKTLLNMTITKTQEPLYLKARFFSIRASLATYGDMISVGYKIVNVIL